MKVYIDDVLNTISFDYGLYSESIFYTAFMGKL